ncbi:MAG TPA: hypothetical protein DCP20_04350 [Coriobacteriia bacterium]|nr:MAG: hypothetical protein XD74_0499 [Actinobacteria bacterium 66_15]HAL29934.1 hypothetical protein [Coriobacteriia bacterium]
MRSLSALLLGAAGFALLQAAGMMGLVGARVVLIAQSVLLLIPLLILLISRHRPTPRWAWGVASAFVVAAVFLASWVIGDWPYDEGGLSVGTDDGRARVCYQEALNRMDSPGLAIPGPARVKITRYGVVSEFRVTAMLSLANIELRAGDLEAAEHWVGQAIEAGRTDSREGADIAFLEDMLAGIRAMQRE